MTAQPAQVFAAIGVAYRDLNLMTLALTHASKHADLNNERLEFLGDRVLGLALAEVIYNAYPNENEGALALRHAALVRAQVLAQIAREHNIADHIVLAAHDKMAGTARLDNVLADTIEALIGALYLDQGYPACAVLIGKLWHNTLADMTEPPQDPKTTLQEWAQARGLPLPAYELVSRIGPDHAPTFIIRVSVDRNGSAEGSGASRRMAEKQAATSLLAQLKGPSS